MINRHYISLLWATILLMVASLTACSSNDILGDIEEGSGDTNTFRLSFDIVLPVIPGSRADSPWEEGWGTYENSINLVGKDYRILLFSNEKKLLAAFTPDEVVMIENQRPATDPANTTLRSYRLYAEVDKSITANTELKLCVVANWGTYPEMIIGTTTIDDLAGYSVAAGAAADKGTVASSGPTTFAGSSKLTASGGRYIPMFGIRDCKGINWVNFNLSWLGELWLLRSVAKIEVKAAEGSPALESVTLNHYNKLGTCAPKRVYRQADYTVTDDKDNGEDKYKGSLPLTLPGDKNDPASGSYLLTSPDNNGTFVVYVPEYQVLKDPSKPKGELVADYPRLQVKFKDIERLYDVDFKYYTQDAADPNNATVGDFFDISRNYYYRYTLRLNNVEPEISVDVLPYRAVELKPNFGLPLKAVTLNKYVVRLYADDNTTSTDKLIAFDENGKQLTADKVEWSRDTHVKDHVCEIEENEDGTCKVTSLKKSSGRDLVTATVKDKNGVEYTTECVVEVSTRHLGCDKTFLGLTPKDVSESSSIGSFNAEVIAETDDKGKLTWKLLDENDNELSDLDVDVTVEVDGVAIENGSILPGRQVEVKVQSGLKTGTAHLWLSYDGPNPDGSGSRVTYESYCEILVQNIVIASYPKVSTVVVGQSTSISTSILPKFSNFIPLVKYRVIDNPDVITLDNNGLVTGLKEGTAKIEAYNDTDFPTRISDIVEVTVKPNDLLLTYSDGNTIASHIELVNQESIKLKAMSNGKDVTKSCNWSLGDGSDFVTIDNIDNKGTVTATKNGTNSVVVKYTVNGVTLTQRCVVVVYGKRELIIQQCPATVHKNAEIPLKAILFPAPSFPSTQPEITWSSNNEKVIAFDSSEGKNIAVAKSVGKALITATATYGDKQYTDTTTIGVLDNGIVPVKSFRLYVTDPSGVQHTVTSEDHPATTENPGANNEFTNITMYEGEEWTAHAEFTPDAVSVPSDAWKKEIRVSWYGDRITITPDGNSCKIKAKTMTGETDVQMKNRYNEVVFKYIYDGKTYTRRFCVYVFKK